MWYVGEMVEAGEICDFKFISVGKILCVYSGHTMLCACVCMSVKFVSWKLLLILQVIFKVIFKKTHTHSSFSTVWILLLEKIYFS